MAPEWPLNDPWIIIRAEASSPPAAGDSAAPKCGRRPRRVAPEAPVRPEAAPPEVLRPNLKAAASLRASRRAWLASLVVQNGRGLAC
jgi:hypothetical protein